LVAACWLGAQASAAELTFGVYGDTPYLPFEDAAVAAMIEDMNRESLAFVVHVGDFKSGSSACSDELFVERRALLARSVHPLVVLPGDNEWTDCHRQGAGSYDPIERLDKLRELFHAGDRSLGPRPMALERQSQQARFARYRENVRWSLDGVMFVALHIVGSNNNLARNATMDAEYRERMAANEAWLSEAVKRAQAADLRALVVFFHADPRFDRWGSDSPRDGFVSTRKILRVAAAAFKKPLLVVHGDGHRYRIDQPLRDPATGDTFGNVTRLEVFGAPETNWARVTIYGNAPARFRIEPGRPRPGPLQ
jgi:hypothetical protein